MRKELKQQYPKDLFTKVYPIGLYDRFITKGIGLLRIGFGISEIHDILESWLLKEAKLI